MQIEANISKEAINEMQVESFQGKIVVVNSSFELKEAIEELKNHLLLGFDTETKPAFAKGVFNKVALMQLATNDTCYLFRLNKIGFPAELEKLLRNKKRKKIGLSLRDDFSALNKRKVFNPESFIDLQHIVKEFGIEELSLQKIYGLLFGKKISKSQRLSNWETDLFSDAQQLYAATDAWACLKIYTKLMDIKATNK